MFYKFLIQIFAVMKDAGSIEALGFNSPLLTALSIFLNNIDIGRC